MSFKRQGFGCGAIYWRCPVLVVLSLSLGLRGDRGSSLQRDNSAWFSDSWQQVAGSCLATSNPSFKAGVVPNRVNVKARTKPHPVTLH